MAGFRINTETAYLGWETLEWEVGSSTGRGQPFSRDFFGTEMNPFRQPPGSPILWTRVINLVDFTSIVEARYYSPGSRIRLRTRASNAVGTTDWTSTFFTPGDFVLAAESPTSGVRP